MRPDGRRAPTHRTLGGMIDAGGQAMRGLRTLALLALSIGLGAIAHAAVAHTGTNTGALVLLAAVLAGPTLWLTRRQVSAGAAATLLLAAQGLVHFAASATAPATGHLTIHGHGHAMAAHGAEQAGAMGHLPSPTMMLAHLIAAAAVGLLYARGEAALWAVARAIQPPHAPPVTVPNRRCHISAPPTPFVPGDRHRVVAARGPPAGSAALAS